MKEVKYKEKAEISLELFDLIVEHLCTKHIKVQGCLLLDKKIKKLRDKLFIEREKK